MPEVNNEVQPQQDEVQPQQDTGADAAASTAAAPASTTPQPMQPQIQRVPVPVPVPSTNPEHLSPQDKQHHGIGKMYASVLRGLGGQPGYVADSDPKSPTFGQAIAVPPKPGTQWRNMLALLVTGLAGGSAAADKAAPGAEGIAQLTGAFGATQAAIQARDAAGRKQALAPLQQTQEAQEKDLKLREDRKRIIALNLTNFHSHMANIKMGNEMSDEVQANKALMQSLDAAKLPYRVVTAPKDILEAQTKDPTFMADHMLFTLGETPTEETDADGNYINESKALVIDAPHKNAQGDVTVELPTEIAKDFKDYGPQAGSSGKFDAGDQVTFAQLHGILNDITVGRAKEAAGWQKAKDVKRGDVFSRYNPDAPAGEQYRDYEPGVVPESIAQEREKNVGEAALRAAETKKNLAEAAKDQRDTSNAAMLDKGKGLTGEDYVKTLPNQMQNTVRALHEGRSLPTNLGRKEKQLYIDAVHQAYPDWDETKSPAYAKTRVGFTSGQESRGINAVNTALSHLGRTYDHVSALSTLPGVRSIAQMAGNENATALNSDKLAVSMELDKAYKNGAMTEGEMKEWKSKLDVISPAELRGNVKELTKLLKGKLDAYQSQWENSMPSGVVAPIAIVNKQGRAAYEHITGEQVEPSASEGSPQSGQQNYSPNNPFAGKQ